MIKDESSYSLQQLPSYIVEALRESGYDELTEVQQKTIPLVLEGADLLVQAQTGTGKTAAFALPIIIARNEKPFVNSNVHTLILTPTRELALQVEQFFKRYAKYSPHKIRTVSLIGGVDYPQQRELISAGANTVIATPGRLIDMLENGAISLDSLQTLVIDEADKLLNIGFFDELDVILGQLPKEHQTLLFSATFPEKVAELASRVLSHPKTVTIDNELPTVENIVQRVIETPPSSRRMLLMHLFRTEKWRHVLVFVASRRAATNLAAKLRVAGIRAAEFHGDLTQEERVSALHSFTSQKNQLLIATDIASRGIDFAQVSHVVNFDLPRSPADYIHRIGRTGRAKETGEAISFIDHSTRAHFTLIEKRAQISLSPEQISGFELSEDATARTKGPAPQKGKRKSKKDRLRETAQGCARVHV